MGSFNVLPSYDFNGTERLVDGILYLLYTNQRRYHPGDTVVITLIKVNPGPNEVLFTYPTTQYYDFFVRRDDETVWRWGEDKFFLQVIQEKLLAVDEMYTAQVRWQITEDITPGIYTVEGVNLATPEIRLGIPIEIADNRYY